MSKYYCERTRKEISRKPLRECEFCDNLIWTDCPKFAPKQFKHINEDLSRFFSSRKGGESRPLESKANGEES